MAINQLYPIRVKVKNQLISKRRDFWNLYFDDMNKALKDSAIKVIQGNDCSQCPRKCDSSMVCNSAGAFAYGYGLSDKDMIKGPICFRFPFSKSAVCFIQVIYLWCG